MNHLSAIEAKNRKVEKILALKMLLFMTPEMLVLHEVKHDRKGLVKEP